MKKVVITGMGAVTAIGLTVNDYWNNLIEGKSGFRTFTRITLDNHDTTVAAEVDDSFEAETSKYWKKRQLNPTTTAVRMGLASAGEAVEDSGITSENTDGNKIGVIYGIVSNSYSDYELINPLNKTLKEMPNTLPALVSMKYGAKGPSFNLSTACASAAYAITLSKQLIESGLCDVVITGGISNTVTHNLITGFNQLLAMSTNPDPNTASRPFTKNRDGFIMGEGGGTLILESEEHAKARNAKIYCELAGAVMLSEAYNLTAPKTNGEGMIASMQSALENAGVSPESIDYINAHGTSTNLNDLYETIAIKEVFGEKAYDIPVSSIKAAIGHTMAAGGALEAIACIKAIETGIVPPTVHYDEPDPELDLNYVPNKAQKHNVNIALSNSFGFGGHNSTLVFRKYEG